MNIFKKAWIELWKIGAKERADLKLHQENTRKFGDKCPRCGKYGMKTIKPGMRDGLTTGLALGTIGAFALLKTKGQTIHFCTNKECNFQYSK